MGKKYCGLILKTAYENVGETSPIEILGKSMLEWVSLAFGKSEFSVTNDDDKIPMPELVKPFIKPECDYIVVLYSDTPLITLKTVTQAIEEMHNSGRTVLKMTRGYVFDCAYLLSVDKLYTQDTFYLDEEDFITAFSFKQVGLITDVLKNRILDFHMEKGVYFEDLAGTLIGCDVVIEAGVTVGARNVITGRTRIKKGAKIGNNNVIRDCVIEDGAYIENSHLVRSLVGKNTKVGPYANLRENNVVGENCKIGDFVELKGCTIGNHCKVGHLAYLGNVVLEENVNVGAGVVFANYDGKDKHTTIVGKNAFIGSSSTIIAPVHIFDGAFIAGGSVINADVPPRSLAIARSRMTVKQMWQNNKYAPPMPQSVEPAKAPENMSSENNDK